MKILLVEDEYSIADALRESLKKENYMVDIASDGESGLGLALEGEYDVILLDIMLPILDGIEVLKLIRKNRISTPVLLLTARSDISDKVMGLDSGADDYLTKPFHTKELLARVRALSRRRTDMEDDRIIFEDLVLDRKKVEISNSKTGEYVKLGAKEFQMLEYILINKEQIISREQIEERVWGYDSDSEYNNVEVYISFLRKKISFIDVSVKIKAIRGIGYKLEGNLWLSV